MEPQQKRQRGDKKWSIQLETPVLLTNIAQAIGALSQVIHLSVSESKITTQAVSSSKSCIVAAELECSVDTGEAFSFSIDSRTFLMALKGIQDIYGILIFESESNPDKIVLEARDPATNRSVMTWKIPKLEDDNFEVTLDTLNYDCEWMYDLNTLRGDLKRCREMDCDDIVSLGFRKNSACSMVELRSQGVRGDFTITHSDDGSDTEGTMPPLLFKQSYCVENLSDFLRAVNQPRIKLFLGPEQPMVVEAVLGSDNGKMSFVQGPHGSE